MPMAFDEPDAPCVFLIFRLKAAGQFGCNACMVCSAGEDGHIDRAKLDQASGEVDERAGVT